MASDEYYTLNVRGSDGDESVLFSSLDDESKNYFGGNQVWMQKTKLSQWHAHSRDGTSQAAICVGNNPQTAVVDVSVPYFNLGVNWPIFYEMAVTVAVDSDKMEPSGICGIEDYLYNDQKFDEARPSAGS